MIRVESKGSMWELDDDLLRYRRWPKFEAPRERKDWGTAAAGPLQDFVWHDFTRWEITDNRQLRIHLPSGVVAVAPWAEIVG